MQLKEGTSLQGGRYRIKKVLGQGGFGITYLGIQVGLNRRVAIKEFFMKEYCNREKETSHVSVPSVGSKELVGRFRQKFVKEAQTIATLNHPNIIRIHDVFEEHGTAYYVMEYHSGGSLKELVTQCGKLDESDSLRYICQLADALGYIHERNMNHLDIKPSNVLLDDNGNAVLIDFGMSKRYAVDGEQTSTTPVGISHGYAPMEQYKKGGVGTFSPATDIYSLGATFYKLLTGVTPPDASDVDEDGLPSFPASVSVSSKTAIHHAMKPKRKDRPQSVAAFLSLLDASFEVSGEDDHEDTVLDDVVPPTPVPKLKPFSWKWLISLLLILAVVWGILGLNKCSGSDSDDDVFLQTDSLIHVDAISVAPPVVDKPDSSKMSASKEEEPVSLTCPFYVSTSPIGATVYMDDKKIGRSPLKGYEIFRGKHNVKLVLDGHESFCKDYIFDDEPIIINEILVSVGNPKQEQSLKPLSSKVSATSGTIKGHAWVDLGLSVKWATMNVGASSPGDYGDYFAWGEVHPKSEYTEENSLTYEKEMGDIIGNSKYDAACYHWGSSWRLPTKKELEELKDKCRWSWTQQDGHEGCKVVGPNGNSLFLPAAGYRVGTSTINVGASGDYWSGSPNGSSTLSVYNLRFSGDDLRVNWYVRRNFGLSVRPVSD